MVSDTVVIAISVASGFVIGYLIIGVLNQTSYTFRKRYRALKCFLGFHAPSGHFESAVGGRDVMRCLYCDKVIYEVQRTKESLKRRS